MMSSMLSAAGRVGNAGSLYFDGVSSKLTTGSLTLTKGTSYCITISGLIGN